MSGSPNYIINNHFYGQQHIEGQNSGTATNAGAGTRAGTGAFMTGTTTLPFSSPPVWNNKRTNNITMCHHVTSTSGDHTFQAIFYFDNTMRIYTCAASVDGIPVRLVTPPELRGLADNMHGPSVNQSNAVVNNPTEAIDNEAERANYRCCLREPDNSTITTTAAIPTKKTHSVQSSTCTKQIDIANHTDHTCSQEVIESLAISTPRRTPFINQNDDLCTKQDNQSDNQPETQINNNDDGEYQQQEKSTNTRAGEPPAQQPSPVPSVSPAPSLITTAPPSSSLPKPKRHRSGIKQTSVDKDQSLVSTPNRSSKRLRYESAAVVNQSTSTPSFLSRKSEQMHSGRQEQSQQSLAESEMTFLPTPVTSTVASPSPLSSSPRSTRQLSEKQPSVFHSQSNLTMASSFSQLRGQQQSEKQQRSSTSVHDYPASSASRARPRTRPQRQPQIVLEIGYDSDKEMGVRVETLQTGGVIYTNDKASTGGESAAFETEQGKELREKPKKGSSSDESNLNRFLEQIFPLEAGDEGSRNQYKEDEDEEEKENITGYRNQLAGAIRFLQAHNYQLDGSKLLGHGGAGFVISARKENGHEVAVKVMPGGSSTAELEVDVVMSLDHENIIKAANHYYEISDRGHCDLHILISNRASMNLSEFIQSRQLFKNPKDKTRFPSGIRQDVVKSIFKQIFRGLQYLHSHFGEDGKTRVVSHGDIKADNILLFFRKEEEEEDNATEGVGCRVQICDFGCSMEVNDAFEPPYFVYGTRGWGPPEMDKNVISREMLKKGDLGTLPQSKWPRFTGLQADIFALGLILHMLIYGDLPLELKLLDEDRAPEELSEQEREMLKLYTAHRRTGKGYAFRHIEDRRVDRVLWSLLKMMLEANPKHRISLANIENQPWVKNT